MTGAQKKALEWLRERNGDGVFERNRQVLIAAGERASFTRSTWNALAELRYVEFYGPKLMRCRVVADR